MKKLLLLIPFMLMDSFVFAEITPTTVGNSRQIIFSLSVIDDSAAIIELENSWAKALIQHDEKTFDKLLEKGFVYSENDITYTREQVLQGLTTTTDKIESAYNENMQVHLFEATAIVTGWLIVKGKSADVPFEHRYRFTDVWMKTKKDWKIVGAHDYINAGQ